MLYRRTRSIVAVAALFTVLLQSAPAFAAPPVCAASGQPFPELGETPTPPAGPTGLPS